MCWLLTHSWKMKLILSDLVKDIRKVPWSLPPTGVSKFNADKVARGKPSPQEDPNDAEKSLGVYPPQGCWSLMPMKLLEGRQAHQLLEGGIFLLIL